MNVTPHLARILVADPQPSFSHELARLLAPYEDQVIWTKSVTATTAHLSRHRIDLILIDDRMLKKGGAAMLDGLLSGEHPHIVLLAEPMSVQEMADLYRRGVAAVVIKPFHPRELILCLHALLSRQKRVVCLGGGSGLYTLLLGLKTLPGLYLTSIVTMSDDGGSSGRLRESFGILPPGDVRRSLVALSTAPALLNELMHYRFSGGEGLKDHSLGNLLLTAMADLKGSMAEAVRAMGDVLDIQGTVLPVTTHLNRLVAQLADGTVIRGETNIDVPKGRDPRIRIEKVWQEPEPEANPNALSSILAADLILLGPGDLFTGIVATLTVKGIRDAVCAARGRTIYLCNLMTKPGETSGFTAMDHVAEVVRYLGQDALDDVLISNTTLAPLALARYAQNGQDPVRVDTAGMRAVTRARVLMKDVGSSDELVRHDSMKLAGEIQQLLGTTAPPPRSR